ncbi:MAG TPA: 50S ribosomal protein L6 [Ktedonobacterales bacterium]|jgi:large subunit ribosomal protein L6
MSRIGKAPISVPAGVKVEIAPDRQVTVTGPKGTLMRTFPTGIDITKQDGTLVVAREDDSNRNRALHGLSRTLLANMVTGVTSGFTRTLEINGVGYRVQKMGDALVFLVGYSHPVQVNPPTGITFGVETATRLTVSGVDKQQVGQVAANIRSIRKPEPYKGKGIKYAEEKIRRKAGKAGKVGGKKK